MKTKIMFLLFSIYAAVAFFPSISSAQGADCSQGSSVLMWQDMQSLQQFFPYSGFRLGEQYFYSMPNAACKEKNSYYDPYYYYPYTPYPTPNPMTWIWSIDYSDNALLKESSYCYSEHILGALRFRVFRCR